MEELTVKSKVTGAIFLDGEIFYALDKPYHMAEEDGSPVTGWAWKCVNSIPMNLDVLELDDKATPVYDKPFVVVNVTNIIIGLKNTPKEVEHLNPNYSFENDEGEPTEEQKELVTDMLKEMSLKSDNVE